MLKMKNCKQQPVENQYFPIYNCKFSKEGKRKNFIFSLSL